jgi:[ribosomal protein S5]-alanine N-acetyltransferase
LALAHRLLDVFPRWVAEREADPDREPWGGVIIDRADRVAVGGMGFSALPDEAGTVEFGYAINPSYRNRGYATEMAQALVAWALVQPAVKCVAAECLEDNAQSVRVLEKCGFTRVGHRVAEEGPLITWERVR